MVSKPSPKVPAGNSSILSGINENFAFHSSPEAFLAARVIQHHHENPDAIRERAPVRAKILNRNIIVLSSYRQVKQVLESNDDAGPEDRSFLFLAVPAYRQLMEDFFPPPNLLLEDGQRHERMEVPWRQCMRSFESSNIQDEIRRLASSFFDDLPMNSQIDLYETLKCLSWKLFLFSFLDLSDADSDFERVVKLQEDLLRGQFSLFPASVNVGFWHSPRKRGIDARKALQELISKRMKVKRPAWISVCPHEGPSQDEIVNYILMATSSLAVKGFASLMLAFLLNLLFYPKPQSGSRTLAEWVKQGSAKARLDSIFKETTRLSPPIVGVLRRAAKDCAVVTGSDSEADLLIPTGFEAWCYFPGANRDPGVFGNDADLLVPDRYLDKTPEVPSPVVFGLGPKSCLGADFVSTTALTVASALIETNMEATVDAIATGVKAWLGHEIAPPEHWARDVKQLPVQRPSHPILVQFAKQ